MKVNIEIDCTPEEARTFLGLPDVKAFNQMMMDEMVRRAEANMDQMDPEVLMKQWTAFGGQMTSQFMDLMRTAAGGSSTTSKDR
tara:strand:- start:133 stop:384 length:252 start_codon:yes stop_codon:yes gene_type:complete